MTPIRAVTFDVDNTLLDFFRVMREGLALTVHEIQRRYPQRGAHLDVDALRALRDEVAAAQPDLRLVEIRRAAFHHTLASIGVEDPAFGDRLCDLYMDYRFRVSYPFDDVLPTLEALQGHVRLGVLSNGNSLPDRCGLPGWFDPVLMADRLPWRKPDHRIFDHAVSLLGCAPDEVLHVGDYWPEDILGALGAGLQAAWLNRDGDPPQVGAPNLASLTELTELLGLA